MSYLGALCIQSSCNVVQDWINQLLSSHQRLGVFPPLTNFNDILQLRFTNSGGRRFQLSATTNRLGFLQFLNLGLASRNEFRLMGCFVLSFLLTLSLLSFFIVWLVLFLRTMEALTYWSGGDTNLLVRSIVETGGYLLLKGNACVVPRWLRVNWYTSISPIDVLHGYFRETVVKVVGRSISDIDGSPPASFSSRVPFKCSLPGQLDVPHRTAQLRGRQREDRLARRVPHDAHFGRQRLPAIPPRPYTQIVMPNTSTHQDPDSIRHQAYLAEEGIPPQSQVHPEGGSIEFGSKL